MEVGDRVRVVAQGTFHDHVGTVVRVKKTSFRRFIWVVFDDHPWQKPGVDWAFTKEELELV